MSLYIYLPTAGCSINILLLLGLGGMVGLLSGLFGVGGGFVLTPLLIMIGIPPTVAAASDSNQIVAASASGTLAHYRLGNVDFKMGILLLLGGVVGSTLGVGLVKLLRLMGNADFVILVCYVAMLGLIGGYMFWESLGSLRGGERPQAAPSSEGPSIYARAVDRLPIKTDFPKSGVRFSALLPVILGVVVGVLAAIMGVGGGFILIPVMVYLLRMPMHTVLGTSLFQIFFTCVNVTIMQSYLNQTVDVMLAILLLIGSSIGAQIGVRISRRLKADQIKILLSIIVLVVMLVMLAELVLPPKSLLSPVRAELSESSPVSAGAGRGRFPLARSRGAVQDPRGADAGIEIDPPEIEQGLFYRGTDVVATARAPAGRESVLRCLGPERDEILMRKGRVWGLWMNVEEVAFKGLPAVHLVATSPGAEGEDGSALGYRRDDELFSRLVKLKESEGLYSMKEGGVTASEPDESGMRRVSAVFTLPAKAPPAAYTIELFDRENGRLVLQGRGALDVRRVGAPARLSRLSRERPLLYGCVAVLIACAAGFAVAFIFGKKGPR